MNKRKKDIEDVRREIGWAYSEMKWLTESEAKQANRIRDELLLSLKGRVHHCLGGNKIYTGRLPPACSLCGQGFWSCLYINRLCSAHCFYCPQDRRVKEERAPHAEGVTFDHPEEYADWLERMGFEGTSFSGGEPFLAFEKMLDYIKVLRRRLGDKFYLWVYTNGDLVDKRKLIKLANAGLNEIRFNISVRNYDLGKVRLATPIINRVTVEIPAIPEDYRVVTSCLQKMKKMGVQYLDLYQLRTTRENYKNYIQRGYTFLHLPQIPIFESEITALKIMKFALDHQIDLPINYCSMAYKDRLHPKGLRERLATVVKSDQEALTPAGYIRKLSFQASPGRIKKLIAMLKRKGFSEMLFALDRAGTEIAVHPSCLGVLDLEGAIATLDYFEPQLGGEVPSGEMAEKITLDSLRKNPIKKQPVAQFKDMTALGIKSFQELFFENKTEEEVKAKFYKSYGLATKEDLFLMRKQMDLLMVCKQYERLKAGFPELY